MRSDPVSIRRRAQRSLVEAYGAILTAWSDARQSSAERTAARHAHTAVAGALARMEEASRERLSRDGRTWEPLAPADG